MLLLGHLLRLLVPAVLVGVRHARGHLAPGAQGHHGGLDVLLHVGGPLGDGGRAAVGGHVGVGGHVTVAALAGGGGGVVVAAVGGRGAVPALVLSHVGALGAWGGGGAGTVHPDWGARGGAPGQRHAGAHHRPRARLHQLLVFGAPVLEPDFHLKQKEAISLSANDREAIL